MSAQAVRAVVLARGLGTRMRRDGESAALSAEQAAAAAAGLKAMMPLGGHLFIEYILSSLADAGISDACLVVAPDADAVRRHFADPAGRRVRVAFAVQTEPRGTADALLAAESFTAGEPFLVVNGDNLYPVPVLESLARAEEPAVAAFSRDALTADGSIPAERIASFALLDVGPDGYVRRIVEKPDHETLLRFGANPRVSMNCWRFDRQILTACRAVTPSSRGELELPLAVQSAIERGAMRVRGLPAEGTVLDLSSRADVAGVTRRLGGVTPRP